MTQRAVQETAAEEGGSTLSLIHGAVGSSVSTETGREAAARGSSPPFIQLVGGALLYTHPSQLGPEGTKGRELFEELKKPGLHRHAFAHKEMDAVKEIFALNLPTMAQFSSTTLWGGFNEAPLEIWAVFLRGDTVLEYKHRTITFWKANAPALIHDTEEVHQILARLTQN